MTPPERTVFIIHGLDQALAACAAAGAAGRPITLLSAPNCAQYAGIGWFGALIDEARAARPTVDMIAILDCGGSAGRALQAINHGIGHLVVDPRCPALPRLRDLAGQAGATLLTSAPTSNDLGATLDPAAACRAALAGAVLPHATLPKPGEPDTTAAPAGTATVGNDPSPTRP